MAEAAGAGRRRAAGEVGAVDRRPSPRVDVCVVGSGPAGALVARELAEAGRDVVVLEAGPRFDPADLEARVERALRPGHPGSPWGMGGPRDAYASTGPRHYPLDAARVKGVGGSTLHWRGQVMRLHEGDFELETRFGVGRDWPIDYADLAPYYDRAEVALGVAGDLDNPFAPPRDGPFPLPAFPPSHGDAIFAEACETLGIAVHSAPNARTSRPYDGRAACEGWGTCQPVCPSGAKYVADATIREAEAAGARVVDRAPVQRLEHDPSGERVVAARYATPGGDEHRQEAREFVLACGGVETPRLLLLSASDRHPDGLANASGAVGRYFMDHLFCGVGGRVDRPTRQHHVGFVTTESHQFYDDHPTGLKLEFLNDAGPDPVREALGADVFGDDLLEHLRDAYGDHLAVGGLVGQLPRADHRVRLHPTLTDDRGNPAPDVRWGVDGASAATIREANDLQRAIMDELDATVDWTVDAASTGPAFHHLGTTRMGTDPADSVVDPTCRTHDVANLSVAGGSVFVTGGAMNPTLTIAALALLAADGVADRL